MLLVLKLSPPAPLHCCIHTWRMPLKEDGGKSIWKNMSSGGLVLPNPGYITKRILMFAFWFPHRLTALRTPFTVVGEGISRFWKQQESFFHVLLKKCSESEASTAQPVLAVWHWKTVWLSKLERFLSPSFNFNGGKVKEKNCKRGYSFRPYCPYIWTKKSCICSISMARSNAIFISFSSHLYSQVLQQHTEKKQKLIYLPNSCKFLLHNNSDQFQCSWTNPSTVSKRILVYYLQRSCLW